MMDRFWEKVDKRGPDECWEWRGSRSTGTGYGQFWSRGRLVRAHRFAYELTHGPLPVGSNALHTCDNPPCCNPGHLRAGSQSQNLREAVERGRLTPSMVKGEHHGQSRLTASDVAEIRRGYGARESQRALSERFGVARTTIGRVVRGETWR